jgi:HK97 family phage major capsid protein/HK97 family phage prohead protease
MTDSMKLPALRRDLDATEIEIRAEANGTRLTFPASSETPVERFFGSEVLSHEEGAIRLDRAKRGAMPLLFNHNWDDPIGMVDGARVAGGRLIVDAHLFATQRAAEVETMLRGGLRNVSIGYRINVMEEDVKNNVFTALDWEPFEVSVVPVPADPSVGLGRELGGDQFEVRMLRASEQQGQQPAAVAASRKESDMDASTTAAAGKSADIQVTDNGYEPAAAERQRSETIRKLAESNEIRDERTVMHWIRSGKSWDDIANDILKIREERSKSTPAVLGMSQQEVRRFSIVRAINAVMNRDWSKAGFEAEVSRATAQRHGKMLNEHSFIMPADLLSREMIVGTASSGGYLVGTDIQPAQFIDLLRNRSVVMRLGARTLSGLQGSVTIPTQAAAGAVGWLGESGTATESNATVGQKTLSPKTVGGYQQYSRQLMLQSSVDVENFIQQDLAAQIALGLDTAALAGTSTNSTQPLGIRYTTGLGTANPTAGSAVAYADMIRFQSTVASSNALFENFSYVCHPAIAGVLMGKPRFTNSDTPIWEGALLDGQMVGRRAMSSLQITSGTVLGGDFSQVVVGEWGTVEIEVNPYANFQAGIVGVRAMYSCDVLVRYGAAFAIGTGITG